MHFYSLLLALIGIVIDGAGGGRIICCYGCRGL